MLGLQNDLKVRGLGSGRRGGVPSVQLIDSAQRFFRLDFLCNKSCLFWAFSISSRANVRARVGPLRSRTMPGSSDHPTAYGCDPDNVSLTDRSAHLTETMLAAFIRLYFS
jgi:hypothetical protein